MSQSTVRVGVAGVQGIGMAHLFALGSHGELATLTAVCDVDAAAAKKAGEDFGVVAYTDPADLFASEQVDAVVLAVPPMIHAPLTRQALDAGLHVYLEKPMTPVAADGVALAGDCDASGRVVAVGYQHRFQSSYAQARELVESGALGTLFRATMLSTNWFRPHHYFAAKPWRGRWDGAGGGVLLSQATHTLDAFVWLTGMPSRVRAEAWRPVHRGQVEGEVSAVLEYASGMRGTLLASMVDPVGRNRIELHGSRGSLVADGHALEHATLPESVEALLELEQEFPELEVGWETLVEPPDSEQQAVFACLQASQRDFLAAIGEGRRPLNHPAEANRAIELANAIYLSATTHQTVTLPLDHDAYRVVYEDLCAGRTELPAVAGATT